LGLARRLGRLGLGRLGLGRLGLGRLVGLARLGMGLGTRRQRRVCVATGLLSTTNLLLRAAALQSVGIMVPATI
jgi:hypothetical protein